MKRIYLAIFGLPKPQREHAQLVDVIRTASGGEFKQFIGSRRNRVHVRVGAFALESVLLEDSAYWRHEDHHGSGREGFVGGIWCCGGLAEHSPPSAMNRSWA